MNSVTKRPQTKSHAQALNRRSFAFILLSLVGFVLASTLDAQQPDKGQRERLKEQLQYGRWAELLRTRPAAKFEGYKLEKKTLAPWQIRRTQEIGKANRGVMTQYVLSKSDKRRDDDEVIRVSITHCASRADAVEGLIDHLTGIQRPDLKLVEDETARLGDLTVQAPGTPAPVIYFIHGNLIVTLENAGRKLTPELRDVARRLDEDLAKKAR